MPATWACLEGKQDCVLIAHVEPGPLFLPPRTRSPTPKGGSQSPPPMTCFIPYKHLCASTWVASHLGLHASDDRGLTPSLSSPMRRLYP